MDPLYTHDTIDIAAPPEAVWRMLTDPALTRQYMFGCEARSDWAIGSRLDWTGVWEGAEKTWVTGRVVAFEPGVRLVYTTFDLTADLEDRPEHHLTLSNTLTPLANGGTRLDITQGDFARVPDGARRFAHAQAGPKDLLQQMKAVAEALTPSR